jgi:penicillin-binding protein 1C
MRQPWRRLVFAACFWCASALALPTFDGVKNAHRSSDLVLLDRHGTPIQTVRIDPNVRRLPWVSLQDMSPALLMSLVLSEDRNFYEHSGVDWGALAKSAWSNAWNTRTRGASTLTMQLAGLIDDDLRRPASGRSITQKIAQAMRARELERRWKKTEILEAYLNMVAFRGEIVGINALSQTLFGKYPHGLDAIDAAIAVALVRGPNASAASVAQRACGILRLQSLECPGITALTEAALARRVGMPLGEELAPHYARQVVAPLVARSREEVSGRATKVASPSLSGVDEKTMTITTTLDAGVQRAAIAALRAQLSELRGRNVEDGAVLVLDNASGEVRGWVGSSGALSSAAEVDGVLARRQPGSTLKPFVYALAFEQRFITPATLLDDSPAEVATPSGLYRPQNYDRHFKGWVSARAALGGSLNVPAVRVGAMLGPDTLFAGLNAFGFALPETGGYYGASLALGSADVTLLALTNAYRALANGGIYHPVALNGTSKAVRAVDARAAYLVTDILADNTARARTFGLVNTLSTRGFAAVKTGTSKDMRDNWCVGYTERYTIGVWVGNASGEAMHDVSGVSGAAPIWQTMVQYLHAGSPSRAPSAPPGVTRVRAQFAGGVEPPRDEIFIVGTETRRDRDPLLARPATAFGIVNPLDGSRFAIDPDIPPAAQRITFEGEDGIWVLDGKRVGSGRKLLWAPWPGRHQLTLHDGKGNAIASVRFEVRGAGVKKVALARSQ